MALFQFKCIKCGKINKLFSTEQLICDRCGSNELKKIFSAPTKNSNIQTVDKYRNTQSMQDIRQELHKRHIDHTIKILPDLIEQHGVEVAKTMGWVDKDGKIVDKFSWKDKKSDE